MHGLTEAIELMELTVAANFVEVFLAKEGHNGSVGINYLTKIELPTLTSLYGAMLAGVDFVFMGAGIPKSIPGILDRLSNHQRVELNVDVIDAQLEDAFSIKFDPLSLMPQQRASLKRPFFVAIVSSATLAQMLARRSNGKVDGFVVEHHTAGGHNAPPRGGTTLDAQGEPVYGIKDECDLQAMKQIGLPFWLAGSRATQGGLQRALEVGAQGIQVGTAFAFCDESGLRDDIKQKVLTQLREGQAQVFSDPRASASGYPFKVVNLPGSLSDEDIYIDRPRICDLGYLRSAYRKEDGSVGFRCPGEPVSEYVKKGGRIEETVGRKCLCNALMSTVGYAQVQKGGFDEPPLVTAGKELTDIARFIRPGQSSYSALDVLNALLSECP